MSAEQISPEHSSHPAEPVAFASMWIIDGPEGMPVSEAKRLLRLRPGPMDLVIYRQHDMLPPRVISRQPMMPVEAAQGLR